MTGFELAVACLALNIYWESAHEPIEGQYAVAFVTINRTKERNLDVCKVVFEDRQFSWANHALDSHGKLLPQYIPSGIAWQQARTVARVSLSSELVDITNGSTHYHADYIAKPKWAKKMKQTGKWGHHLFYREVR